MPKIANNNRAIMLAVSTALASTALAGCTTTAAAPADLSASKAQVALNKGKTTQAISHAEQTVLAEPRNAGYRAMLGAVYMEAGRFQSAATSFKDAMELGDTSGRTALSYALAEIAAGQYGAAVKALNANRNSIDASDLGLALSLAGQPQQGVHVLGNALRSGQATPKVRQNLAYSYALLGNWRAARLMAAEDVPADKLGDRMSEWAATAAPENHQARVANLLNVPLVGDSGQPAMLALSNFARDVQFAAAEPVAAPVAAPLPTMAAPSGSLELPPLGQPTQAEALAANLDVPQPRPAAQPQPKSFESAFTAGNTSAAAPVAPAVASNGVTFVSNPVVQKVPSRPSANASSKAPAGFVASEASASSRVANTGDHLVQLGSFSSEASAKRAWGIYLKRYPELANYEMVITKARVRGKIYHRVSAGGFQRASAASMCSNVKSRNQGCITWAANAPLPGALDRNVRMAAR